MSEWQPIETAPRKGLIDLWASGRRYINCYWDHICEEYRTIENSCVLIRVRNATHWMPLPEPPEAP